MTGAEQTAAEDDGLDYIEEAIASLDVYYEFHQPGIADKATTTRLLESIAESLVSIAQSLEAIEAKGGA